MGSQYDIDIKIAPKGDGLAKVEKDLAAVEKHAAEVGRKVSQDLGDAFDSAARDVMRSVKAEEEFISAAKQATGAIREQGLATERATASQKSHSATIAETARQWIRSKTPALEVIDAVGKIGLAMGTVNQAVAAGKFAWEAFGSAVGVVDRALGAATASAEDFQAALASGAFRDMPKIAQDLARTFASETMWWQDLEFAKKSNFQGFQTTGFDRVFDAAIDAMNENVERYKTAAEKASEAITAAQNRLFDRALAKRKGEQEGVLALAAENQRRSEAMGGGKFWDPRWGSKPAGWDGPAKGGGGGRRDDDGWDAQKFGAALDRYKNALDAWLGSIDGLVFKIGQARDELGTFTADAIGGGDIVNGQTLDQFIGSANRRRGPRRDTAGFAVGKGGTAYGVQITKESVDWAKEYAAALSGPVSSAVDGLIEGLTRWEMSWKDWGRTALDQISQVIIKLLLMQAIEGAFSHGWIGGKTANILSGVLGGGPITGGNARRVVPGDPFGGAGAGSAPIITERVMMPSRGADGGGMAPVVNVKNIIVSNAYEAAREFANSKEGERVTVTHTYNNSGKLGLRR